MMTKWKCNCGTPIDLKELAKTVTNDGVTLRNVVCKDYIESWVIPCLENAVLELRGEENHIYIWSRR